jgi:hypothetical protein
MESFLLEVRDSITENKNILARLKAFSVRYGLSEEDKLLFFQQSIPTIYAMWEGFVRSILEKYALEINKKQIKFSEISDNLLFYAGENKHIQKYPDKQTKKKAYYDKMTSFFTSEIIELPLIIDTQSNLGFEQLNLLLETFSIEKISEIIVVDNIPIDIRNRYFNTLPQDKYPIKDELSGSKNNNLLSIRNSVAHGNIASSILIDMSLMNRFIFLINILMDEIFLNLETAINNTTYHSPNSTSSSEIE